MKKAILVLGFVSILGFGMSNAQAASNCSAAGLTNQGFVCVDDNGEYINGEGLFVQGPAGPQGPAGEDFTVTEEYTEMNTRIDSNREFSLEQAAELQRMDEKASAGAALGVAMSQHQFDPGYRNGLQFSVGIGGYRSAQAISLAIGGPLGKGVFMNFSAGRTSTHDDSVGVGFTWRP